MPGVFDVRRLVRWRGARGLVLGASSLLIPCLAFVVCLRLTVDGLRISDDSRTYMSVARSIADTGIALNGGGVFTHMPLFFPIVVAVASRFTDPLVFVRWMNATLAAAAVFVLGRLTGALGGSGRTQAVSTGYFATSIGFLLPFTAMWSEPLFIVLLLTAILFIVRASGRASMVSVLALGIACVTRYAGIFFLPLLARHAWTCGEKQSRRARVAVHMGIAATPIAVNLVRNQHGTGNATDRMLEWETPDLIATAQDGALTLGQYLLPGFVPDAMLVAAGFVAAAAVFVYFLPGRRRNTGESVLMQAILSYCLLVLVSICLVDHLTPIDNRILLPVIPLFLVLGALMLEGAASTRSLTVISICLFCLNGLRLVTGR